MKPGPRYNGRPYQATDAGLLWWRQSGTGGHSAIPICNFVARIVEDVVQDDGQETSRAFRIEARIAGGESQTVTVPATQFGYMNWPAELLGAGAIVQPGQKEHVRTAIQWLSSRKLAERRVYAHTGWRSIGGQLCFLHSGGAIGPQGKVKAEVRLPQSLGCYRLPDPPKGDDLKAAIRASLEILKIAPATVTVPLFGSIWRAPLGDCQFSVHLSGGTGSGKTALACIVQQHYGAGFNERNVPASWISTGNALEGLTFAAKDTVCLVDDFMPCGGPNDVQRMHREADRVLRAAGNSAGRHRMTADGRLRPDRPPRSLILSTGEEVPRGHSLRARLVITELSRSDLDWKQLTRCQAAAHAGQLAGALSGFVSWLSPRLDQAREAIAAHVQAIRELTATAEHRRTPDNLAHLAAGYALYLSFAEVSRAIDDSTVADLWSGAIQALDRLTAEQAVVSQDSDPSQRFTGLVRAVLQSGRGHLAMIPAAAGAESAPGVATHPAEIGWTNHEGRFRPAGNRIGWINGPDVYLDPEAAYLAVQTFARETGEPLVLSLDTLRRRLAQRGELASRDAKRDTVTIRRMLDGARREVLHFSTGNVLVGKPDISDQPDQSEHQANTEGAGNPTMVGSLVGLFSPTRPQQLPVQSSVYEQMVGMVGLFHNLDIPGTRKRKSPIKTAETSKNGRVSIQRPTRPQPPPTTTESGVQIDDYPLTIKALQGIENPSHFTRLLVEKCRSKVGSVGDAELIAALAATKRRNQRSVGLYLNTVPEYIALQRSLQTQRATQSDGPPIGCQRCQDTGLTKEDGSADPDIVAVKALLHSGEWPSTALDYRRTDGEHLFCDCATGIATFKAHVRRTRAQVTA